MPMGVKAPESQAKSFDALVCDNKLGFQNGHTKKQC